MLKDNETKRDKYYRQLHYNGILLGSIRKMHSQTSEDVQLLAGCSDLDALTRLRDRTVKDLARKIQRLTKDFTRIQDCQTKWIGFQATCCKTALAVPIGCNHRLCNLCSAHRAEHYRNRVRMMFDRLEHPIFLTLTIPNVKKLSKRTYTAIRYAIRKLLKKNKEWMKGGVYSLETTYNRKPGTIARWHVHAHVLIDARAPLPQSKPLFVRAKRRLEFDWLLLTGGRKAGWREADFDCWFQRTNGRATPCATDHRLHTDRRTLRGADNRRVIDVRRVTDRQKAAYEVLKYIAKPAEFADGPEAVWEFLSATRGARMLQTFGTWYGFDFCDDVKTWSHLTCDCGQNKFGRLGTLHREDVFMEPSGRWQVKQKTYETGET